MTTHRIPAHKVVIEDDRRIRQWHPWYEHDTIRKLPHDYTQKHQIIYVPVEPHPKVIKEGYFHYGNIVCSLAALESEYSPFTQDDTLIFQEEWLDGYTEEDIYHCDLAKHCSEIQGDTNCASTMPPELDSQCQQYNVVKVLGVDEKMVSHPIPVKHPKSKSSGHLPDYKKTWHWKILSIEKGEGA